MMYYGTSYPRSWYSTLIFILHQVFNLADKQRVPPNVIEITTTCTTDYYYYAMQGQEAIGKGLIFMGVGPET